MTYLKMMSVTSIYRFAFLILMIAVSGTGCSYNYVGTKEYKTYNNEGCPIEVYYRPITNKSYKSLGFCEAEGIGFINNGSNMALKRLKECACLYGGNAIIISGVHENVYRNPSNTQTNSAINMKAEVIRFND